MCDCNKNLKLNPDILNESMELDKDIYFKLSSILINKNIKIEKNKTSEMSLRKTTIMPGITQVYEENDMIKNNTFLNNVKSFSEIFEKVNLERKNFRNIVVSFLKNKFWKITNSKKSKKFFVNKIKGINIQVQLKRINILESTIEDLKRKINIILKKNNQLQEKYSELRKDFDKKKEEFKNILKQDKHSDIKKSCFLEEDSLEKPKKVITKIQDKSFYNNGNNNHKLNNKRPSISYKNRTKGRKMSLRGSLKPNINRNSVVNLHSINKMNDKEISNVNYSSNRDVFDLGPDLEDKKCVNVYEKKKRRKKKSRRKNEVIKSHFQ